MTPEQLAKRRPPPYLEGPLTTLISLALAVILAVLFLSIGFSRPLHRLEPLANAYRQSGTFSYSGKVKASTPVYPTGSVKTGEPIYPSLINVVNVAFRYRFNSSLAHNITGTIEVRALLLSKTNTWQRITTVLQPTKFIGDTATITVPLALKDLYSFISTITSQSGLPGSNFSAIIQPVIRVQGSVNGETIKQTFSPVLPFEISTSAITLNVSSAPAPPGATFVTPSASFLLHSALNPEQSGSILQSVPNIVSFAKYDIEIPLLRILGYIFAGLAVVLALAHDVLRRRKTMRSDEEIIASRLHALIVPVESSVAPDDTKHVVISNFFYLAGLAQFLQRPILYEVHDNIRTYSIDDEVRRYIYQRTDAITSSDRPPGDGGDPGRSPETPNGETDASEGSSSVRFSWTNGSTSAYGALKRMASNATATRRSRRVFALRATAALVVLGGLITLAVSYTASTVVPISNAGTSTHPRLVSQLAPAACATLNITSMLTGAGHFSNSASHVLIMGSAGDDRITDTGAHNCIVGGAGRDTVNATNSDICIVGPSRESTYKKCTTRS